MTRKFLEVAASALLLCVAACSDDNPSDALPVSPESGERLESSSSLEGTVLGGNSDGAENVSSSIAVGMSSSSVGVAGVSSSSKAEKPKKNTAACLWRGVDKKTYVNTEFVDVDIGNYAGLWYNFGDDPDGGMSKVVFPEVCVYEAPEYECMENLLEYYGGYSGTIVLKKGFLNEALAGVGFDVAGVENPEENYTKHIQRYGDISGWGGVCVTYAADREMFLQLGADSVTFYETKLDKSAEFVEKCVPWSEFVGATSTATSTAAEAAKHAHSVRIVMKSSEDTRGHFNIAAIGKFDATGACEVDGFADVVTKSSNGAEAGTIILRSSSSSGEGESGSSFTPSSSGDCISSESVSNLWYGPKAIDIYDYHVETGLDNGTGTSGYWFSFDGENGKANVEWPLQQWQYDYEDGLYRVVEECKGICGTFKFIDESVTGIGFNVAGVVFHGNDEVPDIADISAWGGLCVTYAAETNMDVVLSNDTTYTYVEKMALLPKVSLPKSAEVKTVCSKWSDFVTYAETPSDPAHVASILFAAYGDAGSASKFNVIGVGKYADAQNVCKQGAEPFVAGTK